MNAGSENSMNATNPPRNDEVAYIEIAVRSWVDVGPGRDWQIVSNSTNFQSFMLWLGIFLPAHFFHQAFSEYADMAHWATIGDQAQIPNFPRIFADGKYPLLLSDTLLFESSLRFNRLSHPVTKNLKYLNNNNRWVKYNTNCLYTKLDQSHLFIINFTQRSSGAYINFTYILNSFLGRITLLYLFKNFTIAILFYNMARCLPMQVRAPALKPPVTNGGIQLHQFYHLQGRNYQGFLKYFSE